MPLGTFQRAFEGPGEFDFQACGPEPLFAGGTYASAKLLRVVIRRMFWLGPSPMIKARTQMWESSPSKISTPTARVISRQASLSFTVTYEPPLEKLSGNTSMLELKVYLLLFHRQAIVTSQINRILNSKSLPDAVTAAVIATHPSGEVGTPEPDFYNFYYDQSQTLTMCGNYHSTVCKPLLFVVS